MDLLRTLVLSSLVVLVPAAAGAQDAADPAPTVGADAAPETAPESATVQVVVVPSAPAGPTTVPVVYAPDASQRMVAPAFTPRDQAPRPSFGLSIGLHVAAAITGPIGMAGLVLGALYAFACSFGGDCTIPSVLLIAGGVLETASVALGISATAVHGHTRARVREWEGHAPPMAWTPLVLPGGGGAAFALEF